MHVLGLLGRSTDEALETALHRLVDRLAREGRVGVVRYDATIADGISAEYAGVTTGGDVTYDLGVDGDWLASGTDLSIAGVLDDLATDCDFALVVGVESLTYPTIVVGRDRDDLEARVDAPVVASITTPGALDAETITEALEAADPHETLASLVERVKRDPMAERSGAIATFTGRVRAKDSADDVRTEYLSFERYDPVATRRLEAIQEALESREGVYAVALHHRTGVLSDGEDIVFVVVLAGHREEAFRAVEDGINRLKEEVPLFKKEVTLEDEYWV